MLIVFEVLGSCVCFFSFFLFLLAFLLIFLMFFLRFFSFFVCFCFFERFSTFGQVEGNARFGRSRHQPKFSSLQEWETTQMDDASYFLVIRLGPKTSECEKNVTVVSAVTGCDATNCATTLHGFNNQIHSKLILRP